MTETKTGYSAGRPPAASTGSPQAQSAGPVRRSGPLAPPAVAATAAPRRLTFGPVHQNTGHRCVLYGPGGIGKTTLAAQAPGPVAFIDLDDSLPRLRPNLEAAGLMANIRNVPVETWAELMGVLQSDGWDEIKTLCIDSGTKAEELAVAHTLETVLVDGRRVNSIEGYGFGKGYGYVFDTFLPMLAALDRHCRSGRNVVLICHDCTSTVPNPAGEDWLRYEPRLQSPASGKASIRLRVREWADHVLFLGYDVDVTKDGKGRGIGTRTLYPAELPHCMAKSRTCGEAMGVGTGRDGAEVWGSVIR